MAESPPIPSYNILALNNIVSIFHSFGVIYSDTVQVSEELDQVPMCIGVGYLESKDPTKVALKNIYNKKTQGHCSQKGFSRKSLLQGHLISTPSGYSTSISISI